MFYLLNRFKLLQSINKIKKNRIMVNYFNLKVYMYIYKKMLSTATT